MNNLRFIGAFRVKKYKKIAIYVPKHKWRLVGISNLAPY